MKRISAYVVIKKEYEPLTGQNLYRAYFRGTNNRVRYKSSKGLYVAGRTRKSDLIWDMLNNEIEPGAIITLKKKEEK